jgi:hypothetical protein
MKFGERYCLCLKETDLNKLASWHTDLDLSHPIEVMTDMTKVVNYLQFSKYRGFF